MAMASYEPAKTGNAVTETLKDTVKTTPAKFAKFSRNQIHFVADNQTSFSLTPNPTTFLDDGYFASGPAAVKPFTSDGNAAHIKSKGELICGSVGMVGYSIKGPSGKTVYLRMLGSNPPMLPRKNRAYVSILSSDDPIDRDHYNELYAAETKSDSSLFECKILSLKGTIDESREATATFTHLLVIFRRCELANREFRRNRGDTR